ncbi:gephyrin-like molybdotransferase Glp [Sulfuriferula sp. AH1]|uniref:molybdopterin molybdotransferase MoeA n=1 Tax=Sulfuriferula sp. AH1 TaxID=1985873 RepID=UPI0026AB34ED
MNEISYSQKPGMLSMDEALSYLLKQARPISGTERVETKSSLGRVLAEPQVSAIDVPPFDNSAMDGYALACADLDPAGTTRLRISQRIPAGKVGISLESGTAARIFTGAPIPPGADAVVMQEDCILEGEMIVILHQAIPGMNIRRAGEDITIGAEILAKGTRIRPQEMGLAASVGLASLSVYRKLRVVIFFTGDEIVMPGEPLGPGQIYNSNRFSLSGLLETLGCEVIDYGIVPDNLNATVETLKRAAREADLIVTSGGVSVGEEDHVKAAVERVGKLDLWRIAIKPGKPLAFGKAGDAFFIGLPGNPVAALVTFCLFVRPFILRCQNVMEVTPTCLQVRADFVWTKPDKRRQFLRAHLKTAGDGATAVDIYPNQSSAVLTSTVWADGLVDLPAGEVVEHGDMVNYIPFSEVLW